MTAPQTAHFEQQLYGAWLAVGLDASPRPDGSGITFVCPCCVSPTRLTVGDNAASCPDCDWQALGEPWDIAAAGGAARVAKPEGGQLESLLVGRRFDPKNPPPDEPVVFAINGTPVSHAGNITAIEAQVKSGKSAMLIGALASTFATADSDCLGWQSSNPLARAVIHFDTEQSRGDHHRLMRRAMGMAGADSVPEWFGSYCITGFSTKQMRESIEWAIADAVARFGGVHSLALDGVADPVNDVNDPEESFAFVGWLQSLAITGAFPVLGVLHLNPGESGKSRGHLGSQLNRKAEHVLRVTKNGDTSEAVTQFSRRAPIPEDRTPTFAWSNLEHRHVTVARVARSTKKGVVPSPSIVAAVVADAGGAMTGGEKSEKGLIQSIMESVKATRADAKTAVEAALSAAVILEIEENRPGKGGKAAKKYILNPEKMYEKRK